MRIARNYLLARGLMLLLIPVAPARADWEAGKRAYEQQDYATALRELKPLAEKGNADAQALLGLMYELGRGLPQDRSQALKSYKAAAEQGNAKGQFHLGVMYLNGVGVARDTGQGLRWLKLSAAQDQRDAYLVLGIAYLNLKDAPRDVVQADMWLRLAAAQGDPMAASLPAKLESHMTRDQIAQAQELATAWKPKIASSPKDNGKKLEGSARQVSR
jgi:uncharacterized protein